MLSKSFKLPPLLQKFVNYLAPSEETVLIGTAIIVGLGTGAAQIIFHHLIDFVTHFSFEIIPGILSFLNPAHIILVPAIGGLLVGLLTFHFAREAKGHGVPEVMEAVALRGGRIRPIVAVIKALASSITIGSGGSAGQEGPIVQIGSALGSTIGQKLQLSDDRIRNLVACGAAAGIAATFNTPIAGVIFALEVILGAFSVRYFSTVVISAVIASVLSRSAFGENPIFDLPIQYGVNSLWEFAFYPIMGILAAILGFLYVRALYWTEDWFDDWQAVPEWVKPAVGGALLGVLALAYPLVTGITWDRLPQIFSGGYAIMEGALYNELLLSVAFILMGLKLVATCLTLGSGGSGGVFAPSLFMGAMLGTGFELVIKGLFPGIPAPPGAYAIVGMAAVFAASTHAPMTAIIMLTELTDDHRIILPLMLTVIIATLLSRIMLNRQSIYTLKLSRRGVHLQGGRDIDIMRGVQVGETMTSDLHTVPLEISLAQLSKIFATSHHHGFPVLDSDGKLWGIVTITDLDRAITRHMPDDTPLAQIATPREKLLVAFPDESISDALMRMGTRGLGRMPVVARDDGSNLIGMVRRADIVRAYNLALARRTNIQNQANLLKSDQPEGTSFIEFILVDSSPVVGKKVKDIATHLPEKSLLVSIQRQGRVIIPHGNTVFQVGDHITAFSDTESSERLRQSMLTPDLDKEVSHAS